jgi:HEAT repeat protein
MNWQVLILLLVLIGTGAKVYIDYAKPTPKPAPAAAAAAPAPSAAPAAEEKPVAPEEKPLDEKELEKLRRGARHSEQAGDRAMYLGKLVAAKDPQAPKLLGDAVATDSESEVRIKALNMLLTMQHPTTIDVCKRALIDDDITVRMAVLNAIQVLGDVSAASALVEVVNNDMEPEVRMGALRTLGSLHEKARADAEQKAAKERQAYENAVKERQLREKLNRE